MLELKNITKIYNPGTINEMCLFDYFSLTLNDGEFLSIVGSNGSGKTSMLNIICGSIPTDGGTIEIGGQNVGKMRDYQRARRIGRVYQNPAMGTCPSMTILENMSLADNKGKPFGLGFAVKKKRAEAYREKLRELGLGLEDKLDVKVGSLSGGQRQAIALLMAVMTPIDFLILDEHTAALDPRTAEIIMELTDKLIREKSLTAMMVTHNLRYAVEYGSRLVMMDKGKFVMDARGDRSPGEFYQLDMEMAFATQDDIFAVLEDVLPPIFAKFGTYNVASSAPFRRIPYNTAMETYGSDKPDLRIDLTCKNVSELFVASEFEAFKGQTVKMVPISDCALTRKQVEKLLTDCEVQSGSKAYWFKVDENGQLAGGIAKFVAPVEAELGKIIDLKPGTLVLATAGQYATKSVGVLIKTFGAACENHFDKERYEFCWIVDFPMYEIGDESGELEFCHNPFSMPNGGMDILLKAERGEIDPLDIYANQYDLVCNGVELSSGAVRNHDPEIMIKAFELVRLGEEDVKKKFPAMYNAFCYGAPPHAGIAPGVDRMVMLLAGESSIREIIPFPMNKNAQDIMMGAPSTVEQKQLDELHIAIVGEVEKDD